MAPNLQLNKSHKLGKLLGEGAFGKVYAVTSTDSSNSNKWAAKIAPKPAKETKKKTSDAEVAYNRLHWELQLYSNHFRSIEGKITAKLPTGKDNLKVFYHDVGGTLFCSKTSRRLRILFCRTRTPHRALFVSFFLVLHTIQGTVV